ncbi:hypothetical protein BG004_001246 [Podila humilis]|nr:hypothetical protein BG004_001246 [Podila humilis]
MSDTLSQAGYTVTTNMARFPALAIGLPLIGGFLSSLPVRSSIKQQYSSFDKPSWAPPSYIFAPTWSTLYVMIGYASHLVALRTGPITDPRVKYLAKTGLAIYGVNLALNFAWTPLMFWKRKMGAALVTAGGLTTTAVAMSCHYFKVDRLAGYLTIPYVAWLCYATALNFDTWTKYGQGSAADKARRLLRGAKEVAKEKSESAKRTTKDVKDKDL